MPNGSPFAFFAWRGSRSFILSWASVAVETPLGLEPLEIQGRKQESKQEEGKDVKGRMMESNGRKTKASNKADIKMK